MRNGRTNWFTMTVLTTFGLALIGVGCAGPGGTWSAAFVGSRQIDKAFDAIKASGEYKTIYMKWFGVEPTTK